MARLNKINRLENVKSGTYLNAGVWARGEVNGWSKSPDGNHQKWQFIKIAGAYIIRNLELGTYLQWAGLKEGERVYYSDGPPSRWNVEEDGAKKIIVAEGTDLALDLHDGRKEGGTAINLHRRSNVSQQKWRFEDTDFVITGGEVGLTAYMPKELMPFPLPTVECYIQSNLSNAALDLYGGKKEDGTPVIGWPTHRGNNQRWILVPAKTGFYVRNMASGTYLGHKEGEFVGQGTVVTCNHNQVEWLFYQKANGWSLRCLVSPWLALDVADNSQADGCKMWLWPDNDGENQKWTLTAAS